MGLVILVDRPHFIFESPEQKLLFGVPDELQPNAENRNMYSCGENILKEKRISINEMIHDPNKTRDVNETTLT